MVLWPGTDELDVTERMWRISEGQSYSTFFCCLLCCCLMCYVWPGRWELQLEIAEQQTEGTWVPGWPPGAKLSAYPGPSTSILLCGRQINLSYLSRCYTGSPIQAGNLLELVHPIFNERSERRKNKFHSIAWASIMDQPPARLLWEIQKNVGTEGKCNLIDELYIWNNQFGKGV